MQHEEKPFSIVLKIFARSLLAQKHDTSGGWGAGKTGRHYAIAGYR
jgi:hypothetical protein